MGTGYGKDRVGVTLRNSRRGMRQKSIANGIANTFVPKILLILFGNTFILLEYWTPCTLTEVLFLCDLPAVNTKVI